MAAKDYAFYPAAFSGRVYLAKKTKSDHIMSQDRRIVADEEIIGMFEYYLKHWCEKNNTDTLIITDDDGNELFRAIQRTKNDEPEC